MNESDRLEITAIVRTELAKACTCPSEVLELVAWWRTERERRMIARARWGKVVDALLIWAAIGVATVVVAAMGFAAVKAGEFARFLK